MNKKLFFPFILLVIVALACGTSDPGSAPRNAEIITLTDLKKSLFRLNASLMEDYPDPAERETGAHRRTIRYMSPF